jgi:hypothetical protein
MKKQGRLSGLDRSKADAEAQKGSENKPDCSIPTPPKASKQA